MNKQQIDKIIEDARSIFVRNACVGEEALDLVDDAIEWLQSSLHIALEKEAEDSLDAAKYRWLRDEGRANGFAVIQEIDGIISIHSAASLDAAI